MKRIWFSASVVFLGIVLAGCGRFRPDAQQEQVDKIPDQVDFSLADLLDKSRADLAAQGKDYEDRINKELDGFRQGLLNFGLLSDARISRDAPVFRDAAYSERLGFSLPPYAKDKERDSALALHLARHGDLEAARKLADPTDQVTLAQIDDCRLDRNYPVEWTRLVGLMQTEARIRLASNDVSGASDIAQIHHQLRELFDEKTAKGPLGAALLGGGRKTLESAAAAWRAAANEGRAHETDAILADWGEVPAWSWPLPASATAPQLCQTLHGKARGHIVMADLPARLLDLCGLPLPREGIDNAFICLDSTGHFREAVVIYQPRTAGLYHSNLSNLGVHLEEQGQTPHAGGEKWLRRQSYTLGACEADFLLPLMGDYLGAIVRFQNREAKTDTLLPRDFLAVHLDRSFEINRWKLAPNMHFEPVRTEDPEQLKSLLNPLRSWKIRGATLARQGQLNAVGKLSLTYAMDHAKPPFSRLIEEAWENWGPARLDEDPTTGQSITLGWEDKETRLSMRLPIENGPATEFTAEDRTGANSAERSARVGAWDRQERQNRLAEKRPLVRLTPRKLEYDAIELGMKRSKAIDAFSRAAHYRVYKLPDVVMVTFDGQPSEKLPFVARQAFLRSDASDRIVEIRVRYQDRTGSGSNTASWSAALLDAWKARCGAPVEGRAPWAGVWPELPQGRPAPSFYRWVDDQCVLTFQVDDKGVELSLRDCPVDQPEGVTLPPLEYLPRGPEGYALGASRAEAAPDAPPKPTDAKEDTLTIIPKTPGAYDQIQLWFDDQKLIRVVARHAGKDAQTASAEQQAEQLREVWAKQLTELGWTRRQDSISPLAQQLPDSLGWQDERTRLRTYWDRSDGKLRMYSEWKELSAK